VLQVKTVSTKFPGSSFYYLLCFSVFLLGSGGYLINASAINSGNTVYISYILPNLCFRVTRCVVTRMLTLNICVREPSYIYIARMTMGRRPTSFCSGRTGHSMEPTHVTGALRTQPATLILSRLLSRNKEEANQNPAQPC
jgi:hypothetical protein